MKRRLALLWLLLFGVYAATLGLHAFGRSDFAGDEPHYLLAAQSLAEDGDFDVQNQYSARSYDSFFPYALRPTGQRTGGRLHERQGIGFPALITPAFALGGATGVQLFMAALAALAVVLAYALALRVCPDPWALGAALLTGLSPPLVAYGTGVFPEVPAAVCLAGGALLALRLAERPRRRDALGCFALLALLPWLGPRLVPVGAVIGIYAFVLLRRARRPMLSLLSAELAGFSVALYVGVNEGIYGGITSYPGSTATGASSVGDYLGRAYRLVALWIDRGYGLLRWAPVLALGFVGLWLLWRGRRRRLRQALPGYASTERAGVLCAVAIGVQLLVAAFVVPTMSGFWFPGRYLVPVLPLMAPLVALGLRRAPRIGALLALLTVAASVWLWVDVRSAGAGLAAGRPDAPWGPLERAWPLYGHGGALAYVVAGAIGALVLALVVVEAVRGRRERAALTPVRLAGHGRYDRQ